MAITYDEIETTVKQKVLVDNQGNDTLVPFIRVYIYDDCGDLESVRDTDLAGVPYTVLGTIEEKIPRIDFVESLKEDDRLKIDVAGAITINPTQAFVYMNQSVEQLDITNVPEVLLLNNTNVNTSPSSVDVSSTLGEYIFPLNGLYEMELRITADTQDNARRTSKTTLQTFDGSDWIDVPTSPSCYGYHRNNASGENTTSSKVVVSASTDQRYRYVIQCLNSGTIKTVPNGTSLTIRQI